MKLVPLNTIFDIEYGNKFDLNKMDIQSEGINFVSRSSQNLGVVAKVSQYQNFEPYPAGLITVTLGGTYLLSSFIQQDKFYTAQNIKVIRPKREMDIVEKIYYCLVISRNRFRYTSHGREANITLDSLLVPENMPKGWKDLFKKEYNIKNDSLLRKQIALDTFNWRFFNLGSLFDIKGSTRTPLSELEEIGAGDFPYVTTQATNNGIEGLYDHYTEKGGVLTVDSAVIGYCSYQQRNFSASDHVEKLIPKFEMNEYIAMFLVTILNKEQYRYNYGRKCSIDRMKRISIKLPTNNGMPDWQFMEDYMKSLPYSSSL